MKRTPLVRKTPLRAKGPIKKANGRPNKMRYRPNRVPAVVRDLVERRSGGRCEIFHPGCTGKATAMHHRKLRSQGGPHTQENLIHVCAKAHSMIHHGGADSYQRGWLVKRHRDPAKVPWTPHSS